HPPIQHEHKCRGYVLHQNRRWHHVRALSAALKKSLDVVVDQLGEYVLKMFMKDGATPRVDGTVAGAELLVSVFLKVLKNRKTEANYPFEGFRCIRQLRRSSGANHFLYGICEQLVFIAEVSVEGGSTNVRPIENLFDHDRVIGLFAN